MKIECNECGHSKEMDLSEYRKIKKIRLKCGTCGSKNFTSHMHSPQNDTEVKETIKVEKIKKIMNHIKEPIKVKKRIRTGSVLSKQNKSNPKEGDV